MKAYVAMSGNCYGRVDVRKRDSNGKFYVLEVNASCGLGIGSSSDFILQLAGQNTPDFFNGIISMSINTKRVDNKNGIHQQEQDGELLEVRN